MDFPTILPFNWRIYSQENSSYISAGFITYIPLEKGFVSTQKNDCQEATIKIYEAKADPNNAVLYLKVGLANNPNYKLSLNFDYLSNTNLLGYNNDGDILKVHVLKWSENWDSFSGHVTLLSGGVQWGLQANGSKLFCVKGGASNTFHFQHC